MRSAYTFAFLFLSIIFLIFLFRSSSEDTNDRFTLNKVNYLAVNKHDTDRDLSQGDLVMLLKEALTEVKEIRDEQLQHLQHIVEIQQVVSSLDKKFEHIKDKGLAPNSGLSRGDNLQAPQDNVIVVIEMDPAIISKCETAMNVSSQNTIFIQTNSDTPFFMALHAQDQKNPGNSDIVSQQLLFTRQWEPKLTENLLEDVQKMALDDDEELPSHENQPKKSKFASRFSKIDVLDIGANIGWFALNSAANGYRTVAIEPFKPNADLIKLSACANGFSDDIEVLNVGLSKATQLCDVLSDDINFGDTHTACSEQEVKELQRLGKVKRGKFQFVKLDDILPKSTVKGVSVMKIDIEGYEEVGLSEAGAGLILKDKQRRPQFIHSELYNAQFNKCKLDIPFLELMMTTYDYEVRDLNRLDKRLAASKDVCDAKINQIKLFSSHLK